MPRKRRRGESSSLEPEAADHGGPRAGSGAAKKRAPPVTAPILDENGDPMYLIEELCSRRVYQGRVQYKVKWLGFPMSQATWEPAAHLPEDYINDFDENCEEEEVPSSLPLYSRCSNGTCSQLEMKAGQFLGCGGCIETCSQCALRPRYCSVKCQIADWDRHRLVCCRPNATAHKHPRSLFSA